MRSCHIQSANRHGHDKPYRNPSPADRTGAQRACLLQKRTKGWRVVRAELRSSPRVAQVVVVGLSGSVKKGRRNPQTGGHTLSSGHHLALVWSGARCSSSAACWRGPGRPRSCARGMVGARGEAGSSRAARRGIPRPHVASGAAVAARRAAREMEWRLRAIASTRPG